MNAAHRPRYLLSGLLECGVCGSPYPMRGRDRYCCSNHVRTGACANGRGIRRVEIEERVLAGLKDELMAPEAAAEAMQAYAEETNRLNRARRASGAADRRELAGIRKKIKGMVAVIQDGGYARDAMDCMRDLEAREAELNERLAVVYRRKVERPVAAFADPRDRDEVADAIQGLIERIVLTPGEKRGEMHAALHGNLGTILEWAGGGTGKRATDAPHRGKSVSVVAGAGFSHPTGYRLARDRSPALRRKALQCGQR